MTTIYALLDPRTGAVRYIGRTRQPLARRLDCHIRWSRSGLGRTARHDWIRALLADGMLPAMVPLRAVPDHLATEAEREEVLRHRSCDLTNAVMPGGRIAWGAGGRCAR